jgi:hypothetical protein
MLLVPGQLLYLRIPADELRNHVDAFFPGLSVDRLADSARGLHHRYMEGHDLLIDVPRVAMESGLEAAARRAGHILLTDYPTRAGIPIPGFSHHGLGQVLESAGIAKGWLQLSIFDTGVGIFAIADGYSSLVDALSGALQMNFGSALQTFGEGTVEIALGAATQNPLLTLGGVLDVVSGLVSTWNTFSVYVNPLEVLGGAGISALIGFTVARALAGECASAAIEDATRSGVVGALFAISASFGYAALIGFAACKAGGALADRHRRGYQEHFAVDNASYELLLAAMCPAGSDAERIFSASRAVQSLRVDHVDLNTHFPVLSSEPIRLASSVTQVARAPKELATEPRFLRTGLGALPVEPCPLVEEYRRILCSPTSLNR